MSQEIVSPVDIVPSGQVVPSGELQLPADPALSMRDEAVNGSDPETKPVSKQPSITPNKISAKPAIAAAIAAFEKNSSDKKPPAKTTVPPMARKPTAPPPVAVKSPQATRTARSTMGPTTVAPKRTSITTASKAPSVPPQAVATTANVTDLSPGKSPAAGPRAAPSAPVAAPLKPNPRISNVTRTSNPDTANKASGHNRTLSSTSSQAKLPPAGTTAPGPTRRISAVPPANKAPLKAGPSNGTTAATRRSVTSASALGGSARLANANSTAGAKGPSHGHSAGVKTATLNGSHSAAVAELETKLSQAESALAEKAKLLSDVESQLEADAKAAAAAQEKLTSEVRTLEARLTGLDEQSRSLENSSSELEACKAELATGHARIDELTQATEAHQSEHAQLTRQHAETVAQVTRLEKEVERLKQDLADAQIRHETALAHLSEQHVQDLESKLSSIREELGSDNRDLFARINAAEARTKQVEEEAASKYTIGLAEEVSRVSKEFTDNHARVLQEIESTHSARVASLAVEHESALQTLRAELEAELTSSRESFQAAKDNAATAAKELEEKHSTAIEAAIEEARSNSEQAYQAQLEALRQEHTQAILKVEADLTQLRAFQSSLQSERDEVQEALEKLQVEKTEQETGYLKQIESLKTEHATQLQAEFTRARDELQGEHIEQLRSFRETSQESTNQLLTSHAAELEATKAALTSDFASQRTNIESELVQVKLELSALHSDLTSTRHTNAEQAASIAQLTEELARVKASLKAKESDGVARSRDSGEIAKLGEALENALEEAQESRSLLRSTTEDLTSKFEHSRERHEAEVKQHIEEKALLKKELTVLKEASSHEADRVNIQQMMIDEITQEIQRETTKREAAELELKRFRELAPSPGGASDSKLAELHKAHNAKTSELEGQLAECKRMVTMAEAEAMEMKNKYDLLEHLMEKEAAQGEEEGDYEGDTTVDRTAPLETDKLLQGKSMHSVELSYETP